MAGLPAGYLQKQMEDYAAGLRAHEVMRDVARFLDSHERVWVANHYAALPMAVEVHSGVGRRRSHGCIPHASNGALTSTSAM